MSNKRIQDNGHVSTNKKLKQINPELNDNLKESIDEISDLYKANKQIKKQFKSGSVELITSPFKCCLFNDFLKDQKFLDNLREEIESKVEFFNKDNDLYKFKQSEDLKFLDFEYCEKITKWLRTDVLKYVKEITGINLYDNRIDITASKYEFTGI